LFGNAFEFDHDMSVLLSLIYHTTLSWFIEILPKNIKCLKCAKMTKMPKIMVSLRSAFLRLSPRTKLHLYYVIPM
jgi:hypothetical protein